MRLIVGISGASGVIMGYRMLKALKRQPQVETHLLLTKGARQTFACETTLAIDEVVAAADVAHDNSDLTASIASGSYPVDGMAIIPCSMKTVAGIVGGYAENLLLRAADVSLKEGRRLVLVPREMPLSRLHLRNLKEAADLGCMIVPPMLTFYNGADTIEKQIDHIIGKVFRQFGLEYERFTVWQGFAAMNGKKHGSDT